MADMEAPSGGAIGRRRRAAQVAGGEEYRAKRREVIHMAATVFQEKGYQAATLHDVASALDTDRATLYYYVSGKEELLRESVFAYILQIVDDLRRIADSDASTPEKLRELITGLMEAYEAHYPHPYVFIQEKLDQACRLDTEWAQQLVGIVGEFQAQIVSIIEQGVRDGELRADLPTDVIANGMFGMINWSHRWYSPSSSRHTGKDIGACFAEIFLAGLVSD
ncbi:MAG: TetR/AcrR family transcriptional regulator [Actinomycetota bacterium]|nr:TetR/AcrR family transcriptional regulator [Actinomycetota bacterium]